MPFTACPVDMNLCHSSLGELVTAAQRIAAENSFVTAEAYGLNHFPVLKDW